MIPRSPGSLSARVRVIVATEVYSVIREVSPSPPRADGQRMSVPEICLSLVHARTIRARTSSRRPMSFVEKGVMGKLYVILGFKQCWMMLIACLGWTFAVISCLPLEMIASSSASKWYLKLRVIVIRTPRYLYGLSGGRKGMWAPENVVSLFSSCCLRIEVWSRMVVGLVRAVWWRIPVTAHFEGLRDSPPHLQ